MKPDMDHRVRESRDQWQQLDQLVTADKAGTAPASVTPIRPDMPSDPRPQPPAPPEPAASSPRRWRRRPCPHTCAAIGIVAVIAVSLTLVMAMRTSPPSPHANQGTSEQAATTSPTVRKQSAVTRPQLAAPPQATDSARPSPTSTRRQPRQQPQRQPAPPSVSAADPTTGSTTTPEPTGTTPTTTTDGAIIDEQPADDGRGERQLPVDTPEAPGRGQDDDTGRAHSQEDEQSWLGLSVSRLVDTAVSTVTELVDGKP